MTPSARESGAAGPPKGPSLSRFACVVPGLLLVVAIAVGGGLVFINCLRASPATSFTTRITALPPETPVFLSDPGIYLVRLPDGVVALSHHESRREDTLQGCVIRWRETLEAAGRRGLFRSDCNGTLYGLDGVPVEANAASMKRHPIKRKGETITVDLRMCISPEADDAVAPCRPP